MDQFCDQEEEFLKKVNLADLQIFRIEQKKKL